MMLTNEEGVKSERIWPTGPLYMDDQLIDKPFTSHQTLDTEPEMCSMSKLFAVYESSFKTIDGSC